MFFEVTHVGPSVNKSSDDCFVSRLKLEWETQESLRHKQLELQVPTIMLLYYPLLLLLPYYHST
jgi:hypothetical protein